MNKKLALRITSGIAIISVSYVIWWLAMHDNGDSTLVAIIAFVFNVVIYFMGRADKYEESNTNVHYRFVSGSSAAPTEPSDNGDSGRPGNEEHHNVSEDA